MSSQYRNISASEAVRLVNEKKPLILDCRKMQDYKAGHIDGAMHAHDRLTESLIKRGDKEAPMLIYCYTGHSSQHVAELFAQFGFKNVHSLEGGYEQWLAISAPESA